MKFYRDSMNAQIHLSNKRVAIQSSWSQSIQDAAKSLGPNTLMTKLTEPYKNLPKGTFVLVNIASNAILTENYFDTQDAGFVLKQNALSYTCFVNKLGD